MKRFLKKILAQLQTLTVLLLCWANWNPCRSRNNLFIYELLGDYQQYKLIWGRGFSIVSWKSTFSLWSAWCTDGSTYFCIFIVASLSASWARCSWVCVLWSSEVSCCRRLSRVWGGAAELSLSQVGENGLACSFQLSSFFCCALREKK